MPDIKPGSWLWPVSVIIRIQLAIVIAVVSQLLLYNCLATVAFLLVYRLTEIHTCMYIAIRKPIAACFEETCIQLQGSAVKKHIATFHHSHVSWVIL